MMQEDALVIVGGGPTGHMLAGELALAKVDVAIVERRTNQDLLGARAGGLQSRVAWVGPGSEAGLEDALVRWFGRRLVNNSLDYDLGV